MPNQESPAEAIRRRVVIAIKFIVGQNLKGVKSTRALAPIIHTTSSAISRWKASSSSYPTLENIYLLCREFGISESWIISEKGEMHDENKLEARVARIEKLLKIKPYK